ncbi:kinase-like protein [Wilcoxina mikolae CBS 423.85]|nr:kinase-like protein [Wilcoxina mikolae CBS 423.85]
MASSTLREKLLNLEVETVDKRRFTPEKYLDQALTESEIKRVLSGDRFKRAFYKQGELTQLILEGGRKLLGILILIEREEAILNFLQRDRLQGLALDSKLPLDLEDSKAILENAYGVDTAVEFCDMQWKVLAPILRNDRSHRVFEDCTILPFIKCEDWAPGGFGDISKMMLCPVHQRLLNLDLDGNAIVIRKKINSKNHRNAENEEERILASLRAIKHPNIIALLASYSYRGVHNLIFPLADGDLEALLRGKIHRPPNLRHNHTILREAHGLSSAIETIHNFFVGDYDLKMVGCHYDLKPKNILVKDDKFLLTDFGLSRLELSDDIPESQIKVQGFYYAPECLPTLGGFRRSDAGKESDVWSFGCILAMIITFLQYGPNGVMEFEMNRRAKTHVPHRGTFTTKSFHANGQLNPAVQGWFRRIKAESQSACMSGTVELVRKLLKINPKARPQMSVVTEELFFLAHKAMFEYSCDRFLRLLREMSSLSPGGPAAVELEMESKRYRIWGETAGFKGEYGDIRKEITTRPQDSSSGISGILTDIEDELQFIESWSARRLSPTFFRLKTLNDKLWASMLPQLVDKMSRALQSAMLDGKTTEDLQYISNTLRSDISSEYNDISALAEFKHYISDSKAKEEVDTNPDKRDEFLLRDSDVHITLQFGDHSLGTIKRQEDDNKSSALIEWITYDSHWNRKLYARVPKIARLFSNSTKVEHSGLRVLRCQGYYRDERKKRFGLIYEIPTLNPKPINLRKLIKNTTKRSDRPMLGDIFELARKIVYCVLEVHKVGWVHKSISSYNIIFLPKTAPEPIPVVSPYLIGFNHSRGDHRQTATEGTVDAESQRQYYHPDYLQNDHGFRPEHDYYSVGLVLLEIGRWRTLGQITQRMGGLTLHQRSEELVKECVENLRSSMGDRYCDAVKACLTSDFGEGRDRNEIRDQFEAKVVNRLAKCQA